MKHLDSSSRLQLAQLQTPSEIPNPLSCSCSTTRNTAERSAAACIAAQLLANLSTNAAPHSYYSCLGTSAALLPALELLSALRLQECSAKGERPEAPKAALSSPGTGRMQLGFLIHFYKAEAYLKAGKENCMGKTHFASCSQRFDHVLSTLQI